MAGDSILSIIYRIAADISGLEEGVKNAGKATQKLGMGAKKVGDALMPISVAIAGIGAFALKSAIDFESSFAGVRKTVDATEEEFTAMAGSLRGLAKEIPVNVNELNRLGEAAGALGIPKKDVVEFTRVMAELGVTTNLTSDQAADSIARIQNIFGAAGQDTERLASTIVALGNAGASTETEIVAMAQRIAGAGHSVGLTQAQVVGFASTLASVGINAEAGGSTISRVFLKMQESVEGGGDGLKKWAEVAGVSVAEFKRVFENDAAKATELVVAGLGRLKESGGNVGGTIEGLVGRSILMKDTLLRLSGAQDLLHNQLAIGNKAWEENTALTDEANKRFATTESQMQLLWNQFKDVAITLGDALLPVMKTVLEVLKDWIPTIKAAVDWFANLSPEVKTMIVVVGGFVAALGPLLVALGTMTAAIGAAMPVLAAVGGAIAAFIGSPIALLVAAVAGVVLAWRNWETIKEIVANVFTAIKTWMVDKFNAIVESIKAKVDAVTGFFGDMYEAVVGHSFVPDMVKGIGDEFGKLGKVMVSPAQQATKLVMGEFQKMADNIVGLVGGSNSWLGKALSAGLGALLGPAGPLSGLISAGIGALASKAMELAKKMWDGIKGIFGGGEEGTKVNPARDAWFAGRSVADVGRELADKGIDGNTAMRLIQAVFMARTMKEFEAARDAIDRILKGGGSSEAGLPGLSQGMVGRPSMAMAGGASFDTPLGRLNTLDAQPIVTQVYLDGRQIAQATGRYLPRAVEQWVGA